MSSSADAAQRKIVRDGYMWNSASGMMNAVQSLIILVFITRFVGIEEAGIFSIAYAVGVLLQMFATYGVGNFQITDIKEKYSFSDYFWNRSITVLVSLALLAGYCALKSAFNDYSAEKTLIVLLIGAWKLVDSTENVFYAMFQQKGRLDIGAKCYTIRMTASLVLYCALLTAGVSFTASTAVTVVFSVVFAFFLIKKKLPVFCVRITRPCKDTLVSLFRGCLPLCVGTTLANYVGNAPKYVIDQYMDDNAQAYFGYIMMPAFVILVLSNFIYQPVIRDFGVLWTEGKTREFSLKCAKMCAAIGGITALVLIGGYFLGIPVLSLIYGVDLDGCTAEFMVLLLGGGVYAMVSFMMIMLTTVRSRNIIAVGFAAGTLCALLSGKLLVAKSGMMGASYLYLITNALLFLLFTGWLIHEIRRGKYEK